jgi:parallel beta-helix repeat protein
MRRTLLVVLLVLLVALSATAGYFIFGVPRSVQVPVSFPVANHSSISIGADTDFTKPGTGSGCECVRSGTGQELDPYVISDWIVNSSSTDGIVIYGTKAYFVITRVVLHGTSHDRGIYFEQVMNGVVENCLITGWWFGIYTFGSSSLRFINNTVTGNQYGIQLEFSNGNSLIANRFDENGQLGIFLRGSSSFLRNNSATRNGWGGINVDGTTGSANENQLESNVVSENGVFGIGVWRGTGNTLRLNTVLGNNGTGIMLTDHSTKSLIEENTVSGNGGGGIVLIDGSSGNTIRGNTVAGNGDGVNYFDLYDRGLNNVWQNNKYGTKQPDSID